MRYSSGDQDKGGWFEVEGTRREEPAGQSSVIIECENCLTPQRVNLFSFGAVGRRCPEPGCDVLLDFKKKRPRPRSSFITEGKK